MTNVIHIIHSKWEPRLRLSGECPPHPIPKCGAEIIVLPVVPQMGGELQVGTKLNVRSPDKDMPLDLIIVSHFGGFFFAPRR